MKKSAIIIPAYHLKPTRLELAALSSLSENLEDIKEHDMFFVCPEGLSTDEWKACIAQNATVKEFSQEYFQSTSSYSSLLMTYAFWKEFDEYEFVLLYQTDAYCIGGNLKHFIDLGFDYIGAPIIATDARWERVPAVGNGGVSLRKVSAMIETTDPDGEFMQESKDMIERIDSANGGMYTTYEDLYFCQLVPKLWEFSLPGFDDAAAFAFDMNADIMYEMAEHQLPLFIHALDKNVRFWWKHIPLSMQECSDALWKNKDGYFAQGVSYQDLLDYADISIQVGAIVCVKNENWHLDELISHLEECGFHRVIIVDNNDSSGELARNGITSLHDIEIDYIEKFRGRMCKKDYDLMSEMYKEAYLYHTQDLTHVMFIDADEKVILNNNIYITDVVYKMKKNKYQVMHVPCVRIDKDGNKSKWQDCKVKSIVECGHDISSFYRETPVCRLDCCTNTLDEVADASSRTLKAADGGMPSTDLIYVENHCTGTEEEFRKHKEGRGWPDVEYLRGRRTCDMHYFNKVNEGTSVESSTIQIG